MTFDSLGAFPSFFLIFIFDFAAHLPRNPWSNEAIDEVKGEEGRQDVKQDNTPQHKEKPNEQCRNDGFGEGA